MAWVWTLMIFVLLWMPPPPPPEFEWWWWDKLVHFGLFAGFGGLWTWHGARGARLLPLGVVVGALTELVQDLLPWERHGSWHDFGFDLIGLVAGLVIARVVGPRRDGP